MALFQPIGFINGWVQSEPAKKEGTACADLEEWVLETVLQRKALQLLVQSAAFSQIF